MEVRTSWKIRHALASGGCVRKQDRQRPGGGARQSASGVGVYERKVVLPDKPAIIIH